MCVRYREFLSATENKREQNMIQLSSLALCLFCDKKVQTTETPNAFGQPTIFLGLKQYLKISAPISVIVPSLMGRVILTAWATAFVLLYETEYYSSHGLTVVRTVKRFNPFI